MSQSINPAPSPEGAYGAIEQAMLETGRGRWFLQTYLERHRPDETQALLNAVSKLEEALNARSAEGLSKLRLELLDMRAAIAETRRAIVSIQPGAGGDVISPFARSAFANIAGPAEQATHAVLEAAETIQAAAQLLRGKLGDDRLCAQIEQQLAAIYAACSVHDAAQRRTAKLVELVSQLEAEIMAIIEMWGFDPGGAATADAPTRMDAIELNAAGRAGAILREELLQELSLALLNETQKASLFT